MEQLGKDLIHLVKLRKLAQSHGSHPKIIENLSTQISNKSKQIMEDPTVKESVISQLKLIKENSNVRSNQN